MGNSFVKANNTSNETAPVVCMNGVSLNENVSLWVDRSEICIYTNYDYSARSALITLNYTKKTNKLKGGVMHEN